MQINILGNSKNQPFSSIVEANKPAPVPVFRPTKKGAKFKAMEIGGIETRRISWQNNS
jgi:hypothetical protein